MDRASQLSQAPRGLDDSHRARRLGAARGRAGDDVHTGGPEPRDLDELPRPRSRGQRGGVARVVRVGFLHPAADALLDGAAGLVVLNSRGGRSMRRPLPLALVLLVGPSLARPLPAQETASDSLLTVNHYLDWEQVADPQISPDGAQIVYTRRWVNKLEDKWESALWIMNADGSHNRFLVKGSDARWAPDGTRILYLADGEPKGTQLFVRWMDAEGASSQEERSEEHTSELQSRLHLVCRLLLEKKKR